jgi:hypothetical protein
MPRIEHAWRTGINKSLGTQGASVQTISISRDLVHNPQDCGPQTIQYVQACAFCPCSSWYTIEADKEFMNLFNSELN